MPLYKCFDGCGKPRIKARTAVVGLKGHKELGPPRGKAVPEPPGMMERKILVSASVDDEDGEIDGRGKPHRADRIQPEAIE